MELIENLEILKVGDYIKIYPHTYFPNAEYQIARIERISKDRIFLKTIRETKGDREEEYHTFYPKEILPIIKTFEPASKKKKLKHKKHSFNIQNVIFKMNAREANKIVKTAIMENLD